MSVSNATKLCYLWNCHPCLSIIHSTNRKFHLREDFYRSSTGYHSIYVWNKILLISSLCYFVAKFCFKQNFGTRNQIRCAFHRLFQSHWVEILFLRFKSESKPSMHTTSFFGCWVALIFCSGSISCKVRIPLLKV